jgi:hypothetical protein
MKPTLIIAAFVGAFVGGLGLQYAHDHRMSPADLQAASGEWKIEIQHPPCDSIHNLEVIWPKDSDGPVSIECNQMPVAER